MTILDKIIETKREEISLNRKNISVERLRDMALFNRNTISIKESLLKTQQPGIIAEHKRKSPSKGIINNKVNIEKVVSGYQQAGVKAVSVLTDYQYFLGKNEDLIKARGVLDIPLLRKEFIIDEYQVIEAKAIGADFILLIAACLSKEQSEQLTHKAHEMGLEVLIEIHTEKELNYIPHNVDLVGVNNRNLKTFEVDIETSVQLSDKIPDKFVKISESGIGNLEPILKLWQHGYKGFLIGENFMKTDDPGNSCIEFVKSLNIKT